MFRIKYKNATYQNLWDTDNAVTRVFSFKTILLENKKC